MKPFTATLSVLLMTLFMSSTISMQAEKNTTSAPAQSSSQASAAGQLPSASVDSSRWYARQGQYFQRNLGVNILGVQRVASGEMLAFRYVILDPEKAKAFNDKRNSAYLIDEKSGVKLTVPQMEKVGALRTTTTPQTGHMYWIVFANTGRVVDAGSAVDVLIGDVRINGLIVR